MDRRGSSCLAPAALVLAFTAAFTLTLAFTARAARADQILPRGAAADAGPAAAARASTRLADSRDWQVLLHYRRTILGGWKSEADGLGFFFAGQAGKTDPAAELAATLTAFFRPAVADPTNPQTMHPQCLFPARYAWLKHELAIEEGAGAGALAAARLVDQPCPLLDTWRTGISAEAVTLVYATAFLNSPASMYGHTFLARVACHRRRKSVAGLRGQLCRRRRHQERAGLRRARRDRRLSRPLLRRSLLRQGAGVLQHGEPRPVGVPAVAVARTGRPTGLHAWETRTTYFDYFFIDENCSYQLLTLLEVADPSCISSSVSAAGVVPADTVRVVLDQLGLVRRITSRPSLVSVMTERKARLDGRRCRPPKTGPDRRPTTPGRR